MDGMWEKNHRDLPQVVSSFPADENWTHKLQ